MRLLLATLSLVLLAACGGQAPAAEPSAPADPAVDDPAQIAGQEAIEAYNNFWIAVAEAGAIPDHKYPGLSDYSSDDAFEKVKLMIAGYESIGHYTKGAPVTNPTVTEVSPLDEPTEVLLNDCADSTDFLVYSKETDELINDVPGGHQEINAVVKLIEGSWIVTAIGVGKVGTCEGATT